MPRIVLQVWEVSFSGYRFLGCPVSFCSGFNISLLIEQPSLLLHNNGNFDPGSYISYIIDGYGYGTMLGTMLNYNRDLYVHPQSPLYRLNI